MKNKKFITLALFFAFSLGNIRAVAHEEELFFPVEIKNGSNLSVIECVALAFKNSPKIRQKKYELDIASSNLGIARSQYFPTFNAGAGFYHENNSNKKYYDRYYRELPNAGVSLNQLVWNFGKTTAYVKMEEFYKIAAEYEFMDSLCSTLFDIKEKYYELLRAEAMLQISENNVEINEHYVQISKPGPDLTTAKVNLSKSKIEHIETLNKFKNAKVDLSNAMYIEKMPDFSIKGTETFNFDNAYDYNKPKKLVPKFKKQAFAFTRDKAIDIAYTSSPDLKALEATKKAMEQSLLFIKRTYFPDLTANVGYGLNNSNTQSTNNSLQVGVNLSTSVNLMELKHSIKGADAQVNLAENEITLFKKDLYYELERAFNNLDKAAASIEIAQQNAQESLDNIKAVENEYLTDKADYNALQDARIDYIDSVGQYVNSLFDYNMALIQVEHAMHYHLVDIHHRSEHAMAFHSDDLIKHLNEVLGCDEKETGRKLKFRKVKDSL